MNNLSHFKSTAISLAVLGLIALAPSGAQAQTRINRQFAGRVRGPGTHTPGVVF